MKNKIVAILTVSFMLFCTSISFADQTATATADSSSMSGFNGDVGSNNLTTTESASSFTGDVGSNNVSVSKTPRAFVNPGGVGYGATLNYFGQPLPSSNFQPVETMTMYHTMYTEGALEQMAKGGDVDVNLDTVNEYATPAQYPSKVRWIKIYVSKKAYPKKSEFVTMVTSTATKKKTNSVQVMAAAALKALRSGCNVIHFTAQGASRDVFSSGWGIGLSHTQSIIYDGETKSGAASGGLGYSTASGGTRDLPWLQGFGLVDQNLVFPTLVKKTAASAVSEKTTGNVVQN